MLQPTRNPQSKPSPVSSIGNVPPSYYPPVMSRAVKNRLATYAHYVGNSGGNWARHNLEAYALFLSQSLQPSSVKAHLSTVRQALARLARDRDYWYSYTQGMPMLEAKAAVDEIVTRLRDAVEPFKVPTKISQETPDDTFTRLSLLEQARLLSKPNRDTLAGLRDAAIIGMALATGLRADELCSLTVADLRRYVGGELAVHVREGKGGKERLVPYGAEKGVLVLVDRWLARAGITEGDVFRGVTKGGDVLPTGIDPNTFARRLARYADVNPHDLRRTYAKTRYQQGMDILAIRDNLGHADIRTTQGYIGDMDVSARVPTLGLDYGG